MEINSAFVRLFLLVKPQVISNISTLNNFLSYLMKFEASLATSIVYESFRVHFKVPT